MPENSAEQFLALAEYCETKAQAAGLSDDQEAWLQIAAEWRALAQQMHDRMKKFSE
jgi:hypothetical protein